MTNLSLFPQDVVLMFVYAREQRALVTIRFIYLVYVLDEALMLMILVRVIK